MRLPSALMTIFILSILSFLAAYGQRYQDVNLEKSSTSKLNEDYELFSKKSATYGRMAVLGGAGGVVVALAGIKIYNTQNKGRELVGIGNQLLGGTLIFLGLGGGITLTTIGLSKSNNYGKKKYRVGSELERRHEPLHSLQFRPGFDAASRAASLSLSLSL